MGAGEKHSQELGLTGGLLLGISLKVILTLVIEMTCCPFHDQEGASRDRNGEGGG